MRVGGVPYCPWWGSPWGKHGVCPFDEPLRAGGRSRSGYHVVVPGLEDCTPDLRRGLVTVCRWGGGGLSSWVRRPAARRAVSRVGAVACSHCSRQFGSAGWSLSAGARRRRTLMSVSCVRAWPHSMGGIQTCWPWVCLRARQSTRSTMASWRPLPGMVRSRRALTVSLGQSSCNPVPAHRGGQGPALEGCSEEVRVADGGQCEEEVPRVRGGVGWMGCRGLVCLRRRMVGPC